LPLAALSADLSSGLATGLASRPSGDPFGTALLDTSPNSLNKFLQWSAFRHDYSSM
jgi:hypothetical protein